MASAHHDAAALGQATEGHAADPLMEHHHHEVNYPNDNQAHIIIGGQNENEDDDEIKRRTSSTPWLTIIGFCFLTFNSGMAVHRSQGDVWAIAFVGFSYADLVALFLCLTRYELAPAGSPVRERLKVAVWLLTTMLTFAFSYKVAVLMPAPVAVVVWLMAFGTVAGGFLAFFVYTEKN